MIDEQAFYKDPIKEVGHFEDETWRKFIPSLLRMNMPADNSEYGREDFDEATFTFLQKRITISEDPFVVLAATILSYELSCVKYRNDIFGTDLTEEIKKELEYLQIVPFSVVLEELYKDVVWNYEFVQTLDTAAMELKSAEYFVSQEPTPIRLEISAAIDLLAGIMTDRLMESKRIIEKQVWQTFTKADWELFFDCNEESFEEKMDLVERFLR